VSFLDSFFDFSKAEFSQSGFGDFLFGVFDIFLDFVTSEEKVCWIGGDLHSF
jgi:hypothetical protein